MNITRESITPPTRDPWVAIAEDESTVLGSGKTPAEALAKAQEELSMTYIITRLPLEEEEDEILSEETLEAIRLGEEEERSGKLKFYSTVEEAMAALE